MSKPLETLIGENIKRLRERRGMSQAELGEEIGLLLGTKWLPQTVSAAERGKRQFIAAEMMVLAYVLGCRVQYLFDSPDGLTTVKVSDSFTFSPDFSNVLESRGVTDEQLLRSYSQLRLALMSVPNITKAIRTELGKMEFVAEQSRMLTEFDELPDEAPQEDEGNA